MIPPKEWVWKDRMFSQLALTDADLASARIDILQAATDELMWRLNDAKEQAIQMAIQRYTMVTASQPFKVKITRPWWMPLRLHRWLFKQVVLFESKDIRTKVTEHLGFDLAVDIDDD